MKLILQDYLNISKLNHSIDRLEKNRLIKIWFETDYSELPCLEEIIDFTVTLKAESSHPSEHHFLNKVLFPVADYEIFGRKDLTALKIILKDFDFEFKKYKNDYTINLLQLGLRMNPNDIELLEIRHSIETRYFENSIHEVPHGILNGMNGADLKQTQQMLVDLDAYELLGQQLGLDNAMLVSKCRHYYACWIEFLSEAGGQGGFEEFLRMG